MGGSDDPALSSGRPLFFCYRLISGGAEDLMTYTWAVWAQVI